MSQTPRERGHEEARQGKEIKGRRGDARMEDGGEEKKALCSELAARDATPHEACCGGHAMARHETQDANHSAYLCI